MSHPCRTATTARSRGRRLIAIGSCSPTARPSASAFVLMFATRRFSTIAREDAKGTATAKPCLYPAIASQSDELRERDFFTA